MPYQKAYFGEVDESGDGGDDEAEDGGDSLLAMRPAKPGSGFIPTPPFRVAKTWRKVSRPGRCSALMGPVGKAVPSFRLRSASFAGHGGSAFPGAEFA
jgi:hypothetical protein